MEKDKNLKKLFQDSFEKPGNLDHNIMRQIRLEATSVQQTKTEKAESRLRVYWISGLIVLTGSLISLPVLIEFFNPTAWLMVLGLAVPLAIDGLLKLRKYAV